jgi:transcriptional regulator with XRE-family HTH domain
MMASNESKAVDIAVGARIRNSRLRNKLSQAEVARHLKLTFQQVQKYEKGMSRVGAAQLFELAKLFSVSVDAFFIDVRPPGKLKTSGWSIDRLTDRHLLRLIEAYELLKYRRLKFSIVQLAEEMVRCQRG